MPMHLITGGVQGINADFISHPITAGEIAAHEIDITWNKCSVSNVFLVYMGFVSNADGYYHGGIYGQLKSIYDGTTWTFNISNIGVGYVPQEDDIAIISFLYL